MYTQLYNTQKRNNFRTESLVAGAKLFYNIGSRLFNCLPTKIKHKKEHHAFQNDTKQYQQYILNNVFYSVERFSE